MKRLILAGTVFSLLFTGLASAADTINAAGATFPDPIYKKWFEEYKAKTGVQVNYQPVGSGAGIKQLTEGTVDFAASDVPMTDAQIGALKTPALHFPTVLGAVVLSYNVPGLTADLKFSGDTIACTVRNISDTGAALEINSPLWFPDRFTLSIISDGLRKPCHIVWRREKRVGVAFD